ncbi:MAG: hypothetical protein ACOVN0_08250 [Niveispirillum sp.]|uniref:hypothetical protein n=1 Tax=Niveispirillum sp. TaxID=1917217 RepID=UPI003BA6F7C0
MSMREKLAWAQFLALLGFGGAYFGPVFGSYLGWGTVPGGGQFMWLVACIIGLIVGQVVLAIGLAVVTAIRSPAEARSPKDERDRQIGLLGARNGYFILAMGAVLSMMTLHMGVGIIKMVNFMFFALLLAELSRLGTQVFIYRRGW